MDNIAKSLANNALAALTSKASGGVLNAIKQASAKTGVNFAYMVQQAAAESNFNPTAKAKTSSASGLYQFIESTWLDMVGRHGAKYGIQTEGQSKQELLRLRNDPEIAASMAAEFASENEQFLDKHWGGDVGATELYFAHFMGAGGAASFMKARDENPTQTAAYLFPKAAQANYNVFYDRNDGGRARSVEEVYQFFDKKFGIANDVDIQLAANESVADSVNHIPTDDDHIPAEMITAAISRQNSPYLQSLIYQRQEAETLKVGDFNRSYAPTPYQSLIGNPIELMMLAQLDLPMGRPESLLSPNKKNSLF